MVTILGTGHVFDLRSRVKDEIYRRRPTVVALELDAGRFAALGKSGPSEAKGPFLYRKLAGFQARLADEYGVKAGDEMLAASEAARDIGAGVALIDVDAQQAFKRLLDEMTWREKLRFLGAAFGSLFARGKAVEEEIAAMEADYSAFFEGMAAKFPTVKRILIDERDAHMAKAIGEIARSHPTLVAVVGDGHIEGLSKLLAQAGVSFETIRLKALREKEPGPTGTATATVSFDLER